VSGPSSSSRTRTARSAMTRIGEQRGSRAGQLAGIARGARLFGVTHPRRILAMAEKVGKNRRGRERRERGLVVLTLGGARPSSSTEGRRCSERGKCTGDDRGDPEARQLHGRQCSSTNFGEARWAKGGGIGWGMWRNEASRRRR
jgi:hypothetical protein